MGGGRIRKLLARTAFGFTVAGFRLPPEPGTQRLSGNLPEPGLGRGHRTGWPDRRILSRRAKAVESGQRRYRGGPGLRTIWHGLHHRGGRLRHHRSCITIDESVLPRLSYREHAAADSGHRAQPRSTTGGNRRPPRDGAWRPCCYRYDVSSWAAIARDLEPLQISLVVKVLRPQYNSWSGPPYNSRSTTGFPQVVG